MFWVPFSIFISTWVKLDWVANNLKDSKKNQIDPDKLEK